MTPADLKSTAKDVAKTTLLARQVKRRSSLPRIIIWGNCQADALRSLLASAPRFATRYELIRIPGAHEVSLRQLRQVQRLVATAEIVVTQKIRNDYRRMPIGTEQILAHAPSRVRVITYPSMFYAGLHPYLVYVHATGELGTPAPMTEGYHDLRFIAAAGAGVADADAARWLADNPGDPGELRRYAAEGVGELARREKSMDAKVAHMIEALGDRAFWTVNHPSNAILAAAANQIATQVGFDAAIPHEHLADELLSDVVAPVHEDVRSGLGLPAAGPREWRVGGAVIQDHELMRAHLAYYRARPEVLEVALDEHEGLLRRFGLL